MAPRNISACVIVVLVFLSLHGIAFSDEVAAGGGHLWHGIANLTSRCLLNKCPAQENWLDPMASNPPTPLSTHRLARFVMLYLQTERSIAPPQDVVPKAGLQTLCLWWEDRWLWACETGVQGHTELPWGGPTSLAAVERAGAHRIRAEGSLCQHLWGAVGTGAARETRPASQIGNAQGKKSHLIFNCHIFLMSVIMDSSAKCLSRLNEIWSLAVI